MPERLHKTSDISNFDTYATEPPLLEKHSRSDGNTALEQTARQVGATMGKAVATMRKAQDRLKDVANETTEAASTQIEEVRSKAQQAGEAVKAKAQEWSEAAAARVEELRTATVEKASQIGSSVKMGYYRTRLRANRMVRKYPVHVVLLAGALGFLVGVGLRIWRANREY